MNILQREMDRNKRQLDIIENLLDEADGKVSAHQALETNGGTNS